MTRQVMTFILSLGPLFLPAGCGAGDAECGGDTTFENFGESFFNAHCNSCHSASPGLRSGAPEDVKFDTAADAASWRDRIAARATGASPTMPPGGGTTQEDRDKLEAWLACGAP